MPVLDVLCPRVISPFYSPGSQFREGRSLPRPPSKEATEMRSGPRPSAPAGTAGRGAGPVGGAERASKGKRRPNRTSPGDEHPVYKGRPVCPSWFARPSCVAGQSVQVGSLIHHACTTKGVPTRSPHARRGLGVREASAREKMIDSHWVR